MNVALAGVTLVASFARFKAPMATVSDERTPSCPFGRWDLSAMVEATRKRCGVQAVRKDPRLIETSVRFVIARSSRAIGPIWQSEPFASAPVAFRELDVSDRSLKPKC